MVRRHPETLPRCDVYVCGFPCKPFSTLHTKSRGFQEVQARPFAAVLRTIRGMLPAAAVLENVFGIGRRRYLQKVWARLASLRWFEVLTVRINPKDMGEPVHRPRLFFICVRVDVARDDLDNRVKELLSAGLSAERCSLSARLLPNTSALLQTEASATTRGTAL